MRALSRRIALIWALAASLPARGAEGGAGLARLAALVEKHLAAKGKGKSAAAALPWRESILTPDTSRLVWYGRSLVARPGAETTYRVALDPATRWYFVAQVPKGGTRPRYFGPLEESDKGGFVEAFAAAPDAGK